MDKIEALEKAMEANRLGLIEFDQIDAYAEHLLNTHGDSDGPKKTES